MIIAVYLKVYGKVYSIQLRFEIKIAENLWFLVRCLDSVHLYHSKIFDFTTLFLLKFLFLPTNAEYEFKVISFFVGEADTG